MAGYHVEGEGGCGGFLSEGGRHAECTSERHAGGLPNFRIGKAVRVPVDALEMWTQAQMRAAVEDP